MDEPEALPVPSAETLPSAETPPSAGSPSDGEPALAPQPESNHPGRFLVVVFLVIILALVLIAATGDPYGAGCGGG